MNDLGQGYLAQQTAAHSAHTDRVVKGVVEVAIAYMLGKAWDKRRAERKVQKAAQAGAAAAQARYEADNAVLLAYTRAREELFGTRTEGWL